jgi:peptide/nickel transport system substrate-binding protein
MNFCKLAKLSSVALIMATAANAENVLRWTSQGDALTMDPHSQNESPTIAFNGQIYEALVARDIEMNLVPELAESWTASPDGWTFKLRQGVTFHDGADFTAEDVVFSFNRALEESSDYKEQVKTVSKIEVIDDYTVKLVTDGANPILPNTLTNVYIMDSGWAKANGVEKPQDFAAEEETYSVRNSNGTGPFKLISRAPEELSVLERNQNWWGDSMYPGNVDRIEYRPIKNAATRVAALLSGEVDFVLDAPLQDLKRIEATDGLTTKTVAQVRSIFFGMDQNLAIDKDAIQRVVMDGLSFPTGIITPPGVLGNTPELDKQYGFDLDKAKSLMAEAGYADGFEIQLDCPNNRYNNDEKICQAAVAMLAKIGVKVNLDAIPKAQHFPKIQKRISDFYMLGWGVSTLDSHYVFTYLFHGEGSWNGIGYNNPRVNEITRLIETETDIPKRTALIDEAWQIIKKEMPYLPIHHQVLGWSMKDNVDVPIAADDHLRPRYVVFK